ncbi:MAG: hypothetical protein ABEN55_04130 [Bradymonadaceae bacterium]
MNETFDQVISPILEMKKAFMKDRRYYAPPCMRSAKILLDQQVEEPEKVLFESSECFDRDTGETGFPHKVIKMWTAAQDVAQNDSLSSENDPCRVLEKAWVGSHMDISSEWERPDYDGHIAGGGSIFQKIHIEGFYKRADEKWHAPNRLVAKERIDSGCISEVNSSLWWCIKQARDWHELMARWIYKYHQIRDIGPLSDLARRTMRGLFEEVIDRLYQERSIDHARDVLEGLIDLDEHFRNHTVRKGEDAFGVGQQIIRTKVTNYAPAICDAWAHLDNGDVPDTSKTASAYEYGVEPTRELEELVETYPDLDNDDIWAGPLGEVRRWIQQRIDQEDMDPCEAATEWIESECQFSKAQKKEADDVPETPTPAPEHTHMNKQTQDVQQKDAPSWHVKESIVTPVYNPHDVFEEGLSGQDIDDMKRQLEDYHQSVGEIKEKMSDISDRRDDTTQDDPNESKEDEMGDDDMEMDESHTHPSRMAEIAAGPTFAEAIFESAKKGVEQGVISDTSTMIVDHARDVFEEDSPVYQFLKSKTGEEVSKIGVAISIAYFAQKYPNEVPFSDKALYLCDRLLQAAVAEIVREHLAEAREQMLPKVKEMLGEFNDMAEQIPDEATEGNIGEEVILSEVMPDEQNTQESTEPVEEEVESG